MRQDIDEIHKQERQEPARLWYNMCKWPNGARYEPLRPDILVIAKEYEFP